jgi:hypothetical protein
MKNRSTMYGMAPPFPSLAGAPPLTPSNVSFRSAAELAYAFLSGHTLKQSSPCLRSRTGPSDVNGDPRGSRNASLRKDCTMAFYVRCCCIPAGRTFPESRLVSTVGHPLDEDERSEGQSALFRVPARRGGWTKHEFAD